MGTGHRKAAGVLERILGVLERVLEADRKGERRLMRVWPGEPSVMGSQVLLNIGVSGENF